MESIKHFGVTIKRFKYSFHINRDEFALFDPVPSLPAFSCFIEDRAYTDETHSKYSQEWGKRYRELCLKNYDLTMEYYKRLNKDEFNKAVNDFLDSHRRFKEVTNLDEYKEIEGYYIMILDEYKQAYIGKASNIKKRIRSHWSNTKKFDRVLLPAYNYKTSGFSIDFFRALDTTRIYAYKHKITNGIESRLVDSFPSKFSVNRIGGDINNLIQAIDSVKKVNLDKNDY